MKAVTAVAPSSKMGTVPAHLKAKLNGADSLLDVGPAASPLAFTVLQSVEPDLLTKKLSLDADGGMEKTSVAHMVRGTAITKYVTDLNELRDALDKLGSNEAVAWGVMGSEEAQICSEKYLLKLPKEQRDSWKTRSRENFDFWTRPGVWMLDIDGLPDDGDASPESIRALLVGACPVLADAPMLWRPSASAGAVAPDGRPLSDLTRCRVYIPVLDASLIPEAGKLLADYLWSAKLGWMVVSKAGRALDRCLVDWLVWQPERIDFAAPSVLLDGITRPSVAGIVFGDAAARFDLRNIAENSKISKAANSLRQKARDAIRPQCEQRQREWAEERAQDVAERESITDPEQRETLRTRFLSATKGGVLTGDFELHAADGRSVRVSEVLANAEKWDRRYVLDPLEPESPKARLYLRTGTKPILRSFLHGGSVFDLVSGTVSIEVAKGRRREITDEVLVALRSRGDLFEFGGDGVVAYVHDGRARTINEAWLLDHMDRVCSFYKVVHDKNGQPKRLPDDAPQIIAARILAINDKRAFPLLTAIVTAPTMTEDGRILDEPGYDDASGILYLADGSNDSEVDGRCRVPTSPTAEDALSALRMLWAPVARFPFVGDVDRGVMLQGLLTACIRASIPTAPGTGFDAPEAGTGKTLLGRILGVLATGRRPGILSPTDSPEEMRKRLFAALLNGERVLLWDNVQKPLGNEQLDAFLTGETLTDRVLGISKNATVPNRAMFIVTGNNLRFVGDACRRILPARLDAKMEKPFLRDFDFDPFAMVRRDRVRYVVAALTIIKAYLSATNPGRAPGRLASFETWDDLVRQPICWLMRLIETRDDPAALQGLPGIADPTNVINQTYVTDPERNKLQGLVSAVYAIFGDARVTVAKLIAVANGTRLGFEVEGAKATKEELEKQDKLAERLLVALNEITGARESLNSRIIGRWIESHVGKRADGYWFERAGKSDGVARWRVRSDVMET